MGVMMTFPGGERTANKYPGEIYNFEGSVWRDVPTAERLPLGLLHAMKVQLEDTFLLVGGVESVKMCSDLTGQWWEEFMELIVPIDYY